jgi:hypothetical protein
MYFCPLCPPAVGGYAIKKEAWELLGLSAIEVLDDPPNEIKRHPTLDLLYSTQSVYRQA